ncbi:3-oxoadipate enol-lactonase 2 [Ceratocystis platani]|uniref:3-oxoadipate enol-lactonase 2 n=1 Tax=Ceratocystis fimbriata f. sp. platani TaxID=88771 RepID=A0A0F8B6Y2_CERFI|nr:3-oxoadipate enol-lactonase 2 [Ceratocystis platani]
MTSTLTLASGQVISYRLDPVNPHTPVVILANPLCAPFTIWDNIVPLINAAGFSVLRYNQPGHGDSSAPSPPSECTFDSISAAVFELLQQLKIRDIHAWVGVSMGAATGIVFVSKYPGVAKKIVICGTTSLSPVNAGQPNIFASRVAAAREAGSLEATVSGTMDRWFGEKFLKIHEAEAARIKALMLTTTLDGFEACCAALSSKTFDLRPLFKNLGSCVSDALLLAGQNDGDLPEQMANMSDQIQNGFSGEGRNKVVLEVIKNAGHVPFIDASDDFVQLVVPFLQQRGTQA